MPITPIDETSNTKGIVLEVETKLPDYENTIDRLNKIISLTDEAIGNLDLLQDMMSNFIN